MLAFAHGVDAMKCHPSRFDLGATAWKAEANSPILPARNRQEPSRIAESCTSIIAATRRGIRPMRLADIFYPHDPTLVIVSVSVAVLAAYVSLDLAERIRTSTGLARLAWLAAAAVSLGAGIWS